MKPIALSMQAFGPFAGTESITFSDLGESPLFLINGPTGSGKTTILDAICYALYGSTTGNERDAREMRCQQSDAELLTEVTFEFSLGGASYRIVRSPDQGRPKKRGEGFTPHKSCADLYKLGPDGTQQSGELLVEKKVSEATDRIRAITGLNAEQFRQVMILPQGQFRKLLMADSKEKQKIFESLFQTSVYSKIEERLKEDSKEIRDAVERAQSVIRNILETGGVQHEQDLAQKIEAASTALKSLDTDKDKAQTRFAAAELALYDATKLKGDFESLAKATLREAALLAEAPQVQINRDQSSQAHAAEKLTPILSRVSEAEEALARTTQERVVAQAVLATAQEARALADTAHEAEKSRQAERAAAGTNVHQLTSYTGKAEELAEAQVALDRALANEARDKTTEANCADAVTEHMQGEAPVQQNIEALQKAIASADGIALKVHKLDAALKARQHLADLQGDLVEAEQTLGKARAQLAAAEVARDSADKRLKRLRQTWHQGQAALLAEDLGEGEPCPVCGSADHPTLATKTSEMVSEEQLEEATAALESETTQMILASGKVSSGEQRVASIQLDSAQCATALGDQALHKQDVIEAALSAATLVATRLVDDQAKLASAGAALKRHAEQATTLRQAADAAKAAVAKAQTELGQAQTRFELSEKALPEPYRAVGQLEQELAAATAMLKRLETSLEDAQQAFQKADKARGEAQVVLTGLQRNKIANEQTLARASADWAQALSLSVFKTEQDVKQASMPESEREPLDAKLAQYDRDLLESKATRETLQTQLKGKQLADLPKLLEVEQAAKQTRDAALDAWRLADRTMTRLQDTRKNYVTKHAEMAELDAKYRVVGTLADVACGLKGSKVSLQRYILGVLLDDVLVQSSQRLMKMSDGRYQLRRKLDPSRGNRASGLDLEVYDDYSGESRSVATLSGGESFLAALSLALGLSDVVQAQTGGIQLDTLFVDEGFGTLDSEALELAVSTLMDLQRAGRMVGIISHVSELKEQMDIRIDLRKSTQGGSSLTVVSPMMG